MITVWVKEEALDDGRAFFTFYCKDQGVGMSEDFYCPMLLICSPQESQTSRSRYEGTGLGLAITKQLVDRMDGRIELKSKNWCWYYSCCKNTVQKLEYRIKSVIHQKTIR